MSMADRDGTIWHDGEFVPWREATTHVLTHSLHYGLAVFEGLRAYSTPRGPAIFRLKEHVDRLFASAHIYMMPMPYEKAVIKKACIDVVRENNLESCYIRPIGFYGSEKMGVSPRGATVHVSIAAWPWGAYLGSEGLEKGIRVKTSSFSRHHVNVTMCRAKYSGTYANSILANQEAAAGIRVESRRLTRDDIYTADEAFFTGTAAEVTPIRELDRRMIGQGSRGPITEIIQKQFFDIVNGESEKYDKWLTYVE